MDTVITYLNQFGGWIVAHTLVAYPIESTAALAAFNLAILALVVCRMRRAR
jgi:hypothetical protein